ncbi:MAG: BNR repeat-containing protein [Opitutaceae bacterium]|jgi:hypothetical protein|nr:BNR repeat-containing protein [Opitutaceae bacterium]
MHPLLLSREGSDRATAYNISNRIVRCGARLFTGWLDAPATPGGQTRARLGVHDAITGALLRTDLLGEAEDNHCSPTLALDPDGRLHAIIGSHGHAFHYRYALDPADPDATRWSPPEPLGPSDTYPSLIADATGTLHLLSRACGERWSLLYRRKRPGAPWEPARALAVSPVAGYNNFMATISTGPDGRTLHVLLQFHHGTPESGAAADCRGRLAAYLYSGDSGKTWLDDRGAPCGLPLTTDTVRPFLRPAQPGLRISNHVVDACGCPWVFTTLPGNRAGALFRRDAAGSWQEIDTRDTLGTLGFHGGHGREVSLSRDAAGCIHLVAATNPDGTSAAWYDPRHELFHLVLDETTGASLSFAQITGTDPSVAHWLPALENWDWARSSGESGARGAGAVGGGCCQDAPWLLHTRGRNLGGIDGDNSNTLCTEVYLTALRDVNQRRVNSGSR